MPVPTVTVAVFNASDDTVEMLEIALQDAGFNTVNGHVADVKRGQTDFLALVAAHDPAVILWDISPPYDQNWVFLQLIRSSTALHGRGFVVTTTNKQHLDAFVGDDSGAIEIIGKPYDLDQIVKAVRKAIPSSLVLTPIV